ncbi:acid-sensing ion channel 1C-like [Watersipora subatra]|uniref:acid-sensing ion channel 1C-like n=1 Tax=Watersipora subatra TaxID=2589382 RepID=UPI00355AE85F
MVLIGVGYFTSAAYLFLRDYSRKIVSTKIKIRNAKEMQFPTVTICNKNNWKSSAIFLPSIDNNTRKVVTGVMKDLYIERDLPPPPGTYNWSDPILFWLSKYTTISTERNEKDMMRMSHKLNETFFLCQVRGVTKPCSEVFQPERTDAGFCHQFNKNGSFYTHTPGISGGLTVVMDALVDEYFVGPTSYTEGFSVAVHDVNQVPLLLDLSYGVKPGEVTQFIVQRKEIKRVPPYADGGQADCFDADNLPNPLHYYSAYSYSACKSECKVAHVLNRCGCRDLFDHPLNGSRSCYIQEMLECSVPAATEFWMNPDNLHKCNCRATCKEVQFTARLSATAYPSKGMTEIDGCDSECFEYSRKNLAMLQVVYGEMTYELLEEDVMYKGYDLIAPGWGEARHKEQEQRPPEWRCCVPPGDCPPTYTAARTMAKIEELGWEVLVHPLYNPDLAPSNFQLFGSLKNHLKGKHFPTGAAIMEAVREWFRTQRPEFYSAGIEKLPER